MKRSLALKHGAGGARDDDDDGSDDDEGEDEEGAGWGARKEAYYDAEGVDADVRR